MSDGVKSGRAAAKLGLILEQLRDPKRWLAVVTIFVPVALLYLIGGFDFLERRWMDSRFRLSDRPMESSIVLVDIDPKSLRALEVWPWPRGYHATLLDRLFEAGAERVGLDVDFSSRSYPEEDAELAGVIEKWGDKVILPVFSQRQHVGSSGAAVASVQPMPELARHATLASINVQPDGDGVVRRYRASTSLLDQSVPAFAAALAGDPDPPSDEFYLDFGIDIHAIPRISYVDVLTGDFDPELIRDRPVIVGATAIEIGDLIAAPVHGVLPGPMIQALAFESRHQSREMRRSGAVTALAIALLLVVIAGPLFEMATWRTGLIVTLTGSVALLGSSLVVQRFTPLILEVTPWVIALVGAYGHALVRRVDQQAVGLRVQQTEIQRTESIMHHVVENSFDAVITLDTDGNIETFNRAAEKMFVASSSAVIGRSVLELVHHPDPEVAKALFRRRKIAPVEAVARSRDGKEFPVEVVVAAIDADDGQRFVAFVRDISERKAQQEQLRYQATHDPLTKLPNRFLLEEKIQMALQEASGAETIAVMLLDLDRFKEINDALGHGTGDALLREVAARLAVPLPETATIARLGGDEFAVLLPTTNLERGLQTAWSLIESLRTPFEIDGLSLQVDTSLGITLYPDHGHDAESLLQRADVAMYVAKRKRSSLAVYHPEQDFNSKRHLMLRADLRHAIHEDQLELYYQPKILAGVDQVIGAEALVRWKHPQHGPISPDEFIGLAEHCGLIRALTHRVIETAVKQLWQWCKDGFRLNVSVNLSARNLLEQDLPHTVSRLISRYGIPPELLTLEITESVIMEDPERALKIVTRLEKIGVGISIDDFGTGYSSLGYLMKLPARELKIDRSFVMKMESDPASATIVRSTIELAHNLGLLVVAEGVETEDNWKALKELGCDIGQGYYFAKPLPPVELVQRVRDLGGAALIDAHAVHAEAEALATAGRADA